MTNECPIDVYAEMDVIYEDDEVVVLTLNNEKLIEDMILKIVKANNGIAHFSLIHSCFKGIVGEDRLRTILKRMVDNKILYRDYTGLYMLPEKREEVKKKRRLWWVYWATHLYFRNRTRRDKIYAR
mgnify:CR=1 FL=1